MPTAAFPGGHPGGQLPAIAAGVRHPPSLLNHQ